MLVNPRKTSAVLEVNGTGIAEIATTSRSIDSRAGYPGDNRSVSDQLNCFTINRGVVR